MQVERFNIRHLPAMAEWLKARGLETHVLDDLPKTGFVVYHDNQTVAAGFIRLCEGNHGLFDSYITNPIINKHIRDNALNELTLALIEEAKALKLKVVLALTVDENTKVRSIKHGFVQLGHTVLALGDGTQSQKAAE